MEFDRSVAAARIRKPADLAEGLAISASMLCLIHCLALPVLIAWSPWVSSALSLPFDVHLWIVLIAGPVSAVLLVKAARHNRVAIFAMGIAGLTCLVLALWLPVSDFAETAISTVGSLALACAHVANWRARH